MQAASTRLSSRMCSTQAIALAMRQGMSVERIHALTDIDPWFLYKLKRINDMQLILSEYTLRTLPATTLLQAKTAHWVYPGPGRKSNHRPRPQPHLQPSPKLKPITLALTIALTP